MSFVQRGSASYQAGKNREIESGFVKPVIVLVDTVTGFFDSGYFNNHPYGGKMKPPQFIKKKEPVTGVDE